MGRCLLLCWRLHSFEQNRCQDRVGVKVCWQLGQVIFIKFCEFSVPFYERFSVIFHTPCLAASPTHHLSGCPAKIPFWLSC
jgi:hypothetical protein